MRKTVLTFGVTLFLVFSIFGQNQDGWNFQADLVSMNVSTNDTHIADKFRFYTTELDAFNENNERSYYFGYGIDYYPVILKLPSKYTVICQISLKKAGWKLGLLTWQFKSSSLIQGIVTTPGAVINEDGSVTRYVCGVRMWDHTITPLGNTAETSNRSPVLFWGEDKLKFWTSELFLAHQINKTYEIIFGIKTVELNSQRRIGQEQWGFIDPYYRYIWDNHVTLAQDSKINYQAIGPSIGFNFQTSYLKGFIKQAALFGLFDCSGLWKDIDDVVVTWHDTGELCETIYYDGKFPFDQKGRATVPNTELNLKLIQSINLNKRVSVEFGIGGFASIFWNMPTTPKWSLPGQWSWAAGTNWDTDFKNLIFAGLDLSFAVSF